MEKSIFVVCLFTLLSTGIFADCGKNKEKVYNNPQEIVEASFEYLQINECIGTGWGYDYHFYRPSATKYGDSQWLWDSGWHMIAWSHRNVENAVKDMRTLLHFQMDNGFVPEIISWLGTSNQRRYTYLEFTNITQMPMLPYSLRAIYEASGDVEHLKEFVPKLVAFYKWWQDVRDPDGDGLISIIHPWESGLDASPLYDPAHNRKHPKRWISIYPKFLSLMQKYKNTYNWDEAAILEAGLFNFEDVGLNCVYADGWAILGKLAQEYDEELAKECLEQAEYHSNAIINKCWDPEREQFISYFHQDGQQKKAYAETIQSLFPLVLDNLPQDIMEKVVANLTNPDKFWLKYPIPSCSISEKAFNPKPTMLLWRGTTWPCTNWIIMDGLLKQGQTEVANELLDRWIELYENNGIYEYYNPLTGKGGGEEGLGMSHTIVDMLYRCGRVQ